MAEAGVVRLQVLQVLLPRGGLQAWPACTHRRVWPALQQEGLAQLPTAAWQALPVARLARALRQRTPLLPLPPVVRGSLNRKTLEPVVAQPEVGELQVSQTPKTAVTALPMATVAVADVRQHPALADGAATAHSLVAAVAAAQHRSTASTPVLAAMAQLVLFVSGPGNHHAVRNS
jgi:hypothetical protein